jgi:alginate O-acetyltransferase complex protein AlgI
LGLNLITITIFVALAMLYALFVPAKFRAWSLFIASAVLIYWLQPSISVRWLDFFLPTMTLALTVATWYLTRKDEQNLSREDYIAFGLVLVIILGLLLLRPVLPASLRLLIASRPPNLLLVILFLAIFFIFTISLERLPIRLAAILLLLIGLFLILKTEILATALSAFFRSNTGQDIAEASVLDLNWLGFSYVAFRLIHTVRDRQTGLLPELSLREYVSYVVFFPSFIAGPIDRAERFIKDFRALDNIQFAPRFVEGTSRITIGVFKKFVIADTLAQGMALNPTNAIQVDNSFGLWILLYAYALRLFFDFSGYTDIAIGIAILFGIKLPENFAHPYTRTSITKFWQSWHISLSDWARFYAFSPLSRNLLRRKPKPPPILIVLLTQLATMVVIGLWHGVTVNFLIWGIWHGLGLFLHKQWTNRTRKFYRKLKDKPIEQGFADGFAWFITFHYVVLGWVWFALPNFEQSIQVFSKLIGMN